MCRLNLLLPLFLSTFSLFAQKHYVGLTFNTMSSFRTEDSRAQFLDDYDKKVTTWEAGILYDRQLFNRFYLSTGIFYTIKGYDRKPIIFTADAHSEKQRYKYIEIPIGIKYSVLDAKRIRFNVMAEIRNQFIVQAVYTPYDFLTIPAYAGIGPTVSHAEKQVESYNDLKDHGYTMYNIGVGGRIELLYKMSDKIYIGLSPNVNYSLKPLYEQTNEKLYSYGVELKAFYAMGK